MKLFLFILSMTVAMTSSASELTPSLSLQKTVEAYRAILQDTALRAFLNTDEAFADSGFEMTPVTDSEYLIWLFPRCAKAIVNPSPSAVSVTVVPYTCEYYPPPTATHYTDFTVYDRRVSTILATLSNSQFLSFMNTQNAKTFFIEQEGQSQTEEQIVFSPGSFVGGQFEGSGHLYIGTLSGANLGIEEQHGPGGGASVGN